MKTCFKKQKEKIENQFKERNILLKKFIQDHKIPVLVHAIENIKTFTKVLQDKKLKLPKDHPEVRKRFYEVWKDYWRSNSEKILEHYSATINGERTLLIEKKKHFILEGILQKVDTYNRSRIYDYD